MHCTRQARTIRDTVKSIGHEYKISWVWHQGRKLVSIAYDEIEIRQAGASLHFHEGCTNSLQPPIELVESQFTLQAMPFLAIANFSFQRREIPAWQLSWPFFFWARAAAFMP